MKTFKLILIGQLIVNLPIFIIVALTIFILSFLGMPFNIGLILGVIIGFLYWRFMVKVWMNWAISKGGEEEKIRLWGKYTLLLWGIGNR